MANPQHNLFKENQLATSSILCDQTVLTDMGVKLAEGIQADEPPLKVEESFDGAQRM